MDRPSRSTLTATLLVVALVGAVVVALASPPLFGLSASSIDSQTHDSSAPTTSPDGSRPDGEGSGPDTGGADSDRGTSGDASDPAGERTTRKPRADVAEMSGTISIPESPEVVDVDVDDLEPGDVTVVTTQGYYPDDEVADLVAFTADGEVFYHEAEYGVYFDVDPLPGRRFTVEYLASKHFNGTACDAVTTDKCTRDVVRRVNLTTGESSTVYSEITPRYYSARQHDADRLNETHIVLGDIVRNRVSIVDTTSDEVVWEWRAEYDYSEDSGGKWFDWTHLNDVEVLPDGRIMASLRNQDSVVFLDPDEPGEDALEESWTLGEDDDLSILHKQHNPDYIPASRGGPAVIVGDSENDRVVEYRRVGDDWRRAWTWTGDGLDWPRDADRLPSGNTVVVDTRGDRVLGVGPDDEVRWTVRIGMPYDVERLGTGDESAGGMAAGRRDDG